MRIQIPIEYLIIVALAVYRLTLLINKESGPFDMLGRFRTWAGVKYDQYSNPVSTGELSAAIICPYCLSVWIAICVTLYLVITWFLNIEDLAVLLLLPFALSGVSAYLFRIAGV